MIYELEHNSRTIGADSSEIGERVRELYSSFCKSDIVVTDIRSAEMSKVVENTYRDVNIAFSNELAKICRADNMDVYEIIRIAINTPAAINNAFDAFSILNSHPCTFKFHIYNST